MIIENLYPYAGDHAVQTAIFLVEWSEPLQADAILEAHKLAAKFRHAGLAEVRQQNAVALKIDAAHGGEAQVESAAGAGAIVFSKAGGFGELARSVTLSRNNCMIVVPDYSRWEQVFSDVRQYLHIVLDEIAPIRPLLAIGLQYVDIFSWKDDPAELDLAQVFAADAYIPPNVFQQKGLWHLHHGYMEAHGEPLAHTRLENVNVDLFDTGGQRTIQITGSHRATLAAPLWQAHLKHEGEMLAMFGALHQANKRMLAKLLTPAICDRIKLTV